MVNINFPLGMKEEEWIYFNGKAISEKNGQVDLEPDEDDQINISHSVGDVWRDRDATGAERVFVRKGAKFTRFRIGPRSRFSARPVSGSSAKCGPAGSMCIGHVEYCCSNNEPVGSCDGETRCP